MAALYTDKLTPMGEHGIKCTDYDRQHRNTQGDHISIIMFRLLWQTVQDARDRCCNDMKKTHTKIELEDNTKIQMEQHISNYFHEENQPTAVCFIIMIDLLATMNLFALSYVHV